MKPYLYFAKVSDPARKIIQRFKLNERWLETLEFFIRTAEVFIYPTEADKSIFYRDLRETSLWYIEDSVTHFVPSLENASPLFLIGITEMVTKEQFLSFINENWGDVEKELKKSLSYKPNIKKLTDIRLSEEIVSLRNQTIKEKPMTYDEIANRLEERHPHKDPDKCYNADQVKNNYANYLRRLKAV